jgi:hypothetical protein
MAQLGTVTLTGASGTEYMFNVYPCGTKFETFGAVYYVSKRTEQPDGTGSHAEIYIGQAKDMSGVFENHPKESCFEKHNANCISVREDSHEDERLKIEKDLIEAYKPPCNE